MADRKRVYHPETDEPFDPPVRRANDLILNHGWRQTPLDPTAEPRVLNTGRGIDPFEDEGEEPSYYRDEETDAESTA